jgi:outer membrane protein assembly factor BamB
VFSTPHLFSLEGVKAAVSVSTDGLVVATALRTGAKLFSFKLEADKGIFSSPVVYGGKLIVGSRDNFVYCFEIDVIK